MPLSVGDKLGPYEILAPIGAGGMGEVYRARDPRLKREVAVKILPQEFATDPVRRQRFESEARAVATLNHPNIIAIYDVGTENGTSYIVTELIDGQPLRGHVSGLRKTLDWAVQIANGLAAAHAAGIVHRDLKPENILLTRDGRIKILDFGLAKLNVPRAAAAATETMTVQTEPGTVMGTVGYMSPEQVRGKEADHRSDIFSFGVILYEMLSGRRAFQDDTAVETMTAILKQELPDLPDTVPSGVRQTVHHCLEKDPVNRFQSALDLSFALSAFVASGEPERRAPEVTRKAALAPLDVGGRRGGVADGADDCRLPPGGAGAAAHELDWSAFGRTGNRVQTALLARRPACGILRCGGRLHASRRNETRDRQLVDAHP